MKSEYEFSRLPSEEEGVLQVGKPADAMIAEQESMEDLERSVAGAEAEGAAGTVTQLLPLR